MTLWKWINAAAAIGLSLAGIVTIVQFSILVWQEKSAPNVRKFRRLAIRFAVLVGLCLLLQIINYTVRMNYMSAML